MTKIDPKSADDYKVQIDKELGLMRISHCNIDGVISYQILQSDEAYIFAQKILRGYDQLENIT
jgi:hypothetical protein